MTVEDKLKQLRVKWVENPQQREIILRQVKALKYSIEPYKNKEQEKTEKLVSDVIDNLM